jgi:hypothetical protein
LALSRSWYSICAVTNIDKAEKEHDMVTESAFFYLVLVTILMVVLNALATLSHNRHDRQLLI